MNSHLRERLENRRGRKAPRIERRFNPSPVITRDDSLLKPEQLRPILLKETLLDHGVPLRIANAIWRDAVAKSHIRAPIPTVESLAEMSDQQLMQIRNMGPLSIGKLREALSRQTRLTESTG